MPIEVFPPAGAGRRARSGVLVSCLAALVLAAPAWSAQKWQLSYFYDKDRSSLVINDLEFFTPEHGVAVGYLEDKDKSKPVSIITVDGGAHWTVSSLHDVPISMFVLNETTGWLVTPKAIWQTVDAARTWRELPKSPKLLMQVYFLDENRGFAVGAHKLAYQTADGGKTWEPIAAAGEPQTDPENTVYNSITFVNKKYGMISGFSSPPRKGDDGKPEWLDPKGTAVTRREWPHLSIMLDTHDSGATWTQSTSSMFGHITRGLFLPDGRGLGLIEFSGTFKWPSEVHLIDGTTGKSSLVYNASDRAITDLLVQPSGTGYLAGVEVVGEMQHSPIPRKVVILKSMNLTEWQEMDVDYRATAVRTLLRAAADGSLWAATDSGMILKLTGMP